MTGAGRPEVVVAGGGAVGLAAALAFAAEGRQVLLLAPEGAPAAPPADGHDLRVYALSPASTDGLAALGAWPPEDGRAFAYAGMRVWSDRPDQSLRFDVGDALAPALGHIVEHAVLMRALWSRLEAVGIPWRETAVEELERLPDGRLRLYCQDGEVLTPRLLVAADGAASTLREAAGIDVDAWSYEQRGLVGNFSCEGSLEATAWQRFLPGGPLALLPLGPQLASIVWSLEDAHADALLALDDAAFAAELERATQGRFGSFRCEGPRAGFPLRHLHAKRYAAAGIALVGDAAHVIHPLAGQGLNLGLADVAELRRCQVGEALGAARALAGYSRRRRAATADMVAVTDGLHRLFTQAGPELAELRGLGLDLVDRLPPLRRWLATRATGA